MEANYNEQSAPLEILELRKQQVLDTLGRIARERALSDRAYSFNVQRLLALNDLMRGCNGEAS